MSRSRRQRERRNAKKGSPNSKRKRDSKNLSKKVSSSQTKTSQPRKTSWSSKLRKLLKW